MSARGAAAGRDDQAGPGEAGKKRSVQKSIVEKWIAESDKTLNTTVWLTYDMDRTRHVVALKCSVCKRFKDRLVGRRNYSAAYIDGSTNLRASSFKEHAASDMHARAMLGHDLDQLPLMTGHFKVITSFFWSAVNQCSCICSALHIHFLS